MGERGNKQRSPLTHGVTASVHLRVKSLRVLIRARSDQFHAEPNTLWWCVYVLYFNTDPPRCPDCKSFKIMILSRANYSFIIIIIITCLCALIEQSFRERILLTIVQENIRETDARDLPIWPIDTDLWNIKCLLIQSGLNCIIGLLINRWGMLQKPLIKHLSFNHSSFS